MKTNALVVLLVSASGLFAADVPSLEFKAHTFATPPLKLGDMLNQKPPTMTFKSPMLPTPPDRFQPALRPKPDPKMRLVQPRTDIDFKMIVKEPDPNIDPKFIVPAPQAPVKLGGGK